MNNKLTPEVTPQLNAKFLKHVPQLFEGSVVKYTQK